jgi:Protein of unknown function (DUF3429)
MPFPPDPDTPSRLAQQLGYAGLIPFILLPALLWIVRPELQAWVALALTSYAALIASFLGGIHWGMQKVNDVQPDSLASTNASSVQHRLHLVWGVTPSLVAWVALLMPSYAGLPLLAALLIACFLVDCKTYPSAGWTAWLPMRQRLTAIATLSCLVAAGAV